MENCNSKNEILIDLDSLPSYDVADIVAEYLELKRQQHVREFAQYLRCKAQFEGCVLTQKTPCADFDQREQ